MNHIFFSWRGSKSRVLLPLFMHVSVMYFSNNCIFCNKDALFFYFGKANKIMNVILTNFLKKKRKCEGFLFALKSIIKSHGIKRWA